MSLSVDGAAVAYTSFMLGFMYPKRQAMVLTFASCLFDASIGVFAVTYLEVQRFHRILRIRGPWPRPHCVAHLSLA